MLREYTCIMCPRGCEIRTEIDDDKTIISIEGNHCDKGAGYVRQEVTAPMRNIATSVLVEGGDMPLVSVRLSEPIPKARIFDVVQAIHELRLAAPVEQGSVLIEDILGLGADVLATRSVGRRDHRGITATNRD